MEEDVVFAGFDTLQMFMKECLMAAGVPADDAETVSDVLIEADKFGIDSHGINRLKPIYIDRIRDGILNPVTKIDVVKDTFTTAVLDANNGMGHVVSKAAMKMAIEKARVYGMGMVAVRNSSHYGIAGYYGMMAAAENMIGITGTNARPSIAPTFGIDNMLGTNPLTFVVPSDEDFPFFLDCATSVSQRGKIEFYAKNGKQLPKGWVIDRSGESKTDPAEVLTDLTKGNAALTPLGGIGEETGGYKGYGYATVVEILSAALQGGVFMNALTGFDNGKKVPYRLGHFFIAINIGHFTEVSEFKSTTGNILRELRNSAKMPGAERIYTAGEKEYIHLQERSLSGVPLNKAMRMEIRALAEMFKLSGYEHLY
ncbi:MAG: Ldh family oxidoreductase [Bacteroidales bacterium]|nr:Ldh family oxidoreductase [Bacteroidales bacterium]HOY37882.1 Ldh family oxidoreductase [Bacteroidales bacterium]HQP03839.1 Ldh family oxidoreductase [Bacteroidales bacterium]